MLLRLRYVRSGGAAGMAAAGGAAGLGAAAAGLLGNTKAGKQLKMAQQGKKMADGLVRVCLHLSVSKSSVI